MVRGIAKGLDDYRKALAGLTDGEPLADHAEAMRAAVRTFEAGAFEVAELCGIPEFLNLSETFQLEALSGRVIAVAVREARTLLSSQTAEDTARTASAQKQRRYRERKRGRVAKRVRVNVHDGDLDLLQRLGFLTAAQKADEIAIADALEAFLLNSYLGPTVATPWRARVAAQRARLDLLREGKG